MGKEMTPGERRDRESRRTGRVHQPPTRLISPIKRKIALGMGLNPEAVDSADLRKVESEYRRQVGI